MEKSPFIKALNYGKPWCSVLIVYVNDFFTHTSSLIRLYYPSINFTHFKKITINRRWKRYRCREWVIMCRRSISFPSFLVTRFVLWKPRKKIHQCGFVGLWDFNNLSLHWKKNLSIEEIPPMLNLLIGYILQYTWALLCAGVDTWTNSLQMSAMNQPVMKPRQSEALPSE